jgi:hypothetical protein
VVRPARQGETSVVIDSEDAKEVREAGPGLVQMTWIGGESLCRHIAGSPEAFASYPWRDWGMVRDGRLTWTWVNEIVRVDGDRVELKKPLRLAVHPDWRVTIGRLRAVREVGIESLTLRMPPHPPREHLQDAGYNAVCMTSAVHGWIRDVTMENVDNGVILEHTSHVTVDGLVLTGDKHHHATSFALISNDNRVTNFHIRSKPWHGFSVQDLSSGNVWHRGVLEHGTLDSHRGMPFDSLRTNIEIRNDGRPGGAKGAGPFAGRRIVHWNLRVTHPDPRKGGRWIANPELLPMGALVGIQGAALVQDTKPPDLDVMPPGGKGCLVVDLGATPQPEDLYEAQLRLRLGK